MQFAATQAESFKVMFRCRIAHGELQPAACIPEHRVELAPGLDQHLASASVRNHSQ